MKFLLILFTYIFLLNPANDTTDEFSIYLGYPNNKTIPDYSLFILGENGCGYYSLIGEHGLFMSIPLKFQIDDDTIRMDFITSAGTAHFFTDSPYHFKYEKNRISIPCKVDNFVRKDFRKKKTRKFEKYVNQSIMYCNELVNSPLSRKSSGGGIE